jgi:MSHA biogenesis protein MshP
MTKQRLIDSTGQRGFAAIAAIFLVVALAALGAFMVTFSNTQQVTLAQDVQGSRAYWAARAGLEWGIVNSAAAAAAIGADCSGAAMPTPTTTTLTIEGFTVAITCPRTAYVDGDSLHIFQITAIASSGTVGGVGYTERSVSASVCRLQAAPYTVC